MNKDLEMKLVRNYPIIFSQYGGDKRQTCMSWGMSCGNGWYNLINNLCEDVTTTIGNKNIKIIAAQVKEKFGGLRFYYDIDAPDTFVSKIDYIVSNAMFKIRLGKLYWRIQDFRKKFYRTTLEKIEDIISNAEHKSYKICEICGEPGKTRGQGWVTTQCKKCWDKTLNKRSCGLVV